MTRGHNIVADGWAGASNPHPNPNPPPTLKHTQKLSKTLVFPLFNSMTMTDGWTKPLIESATKKKWTRMISSSRSVWRQSVRWSVTAESKCVERRIYSKLVFLIVFVHQCVCVRRGVTHPIFFFCLFVCLFVFVFLMLLFLYCLFNVEPLLLAVPFASLPEGKFVPNCEFYFDI